MTTAATLFSGGGGADIGLSNAGLNVKWGLEYDDNIAYVARDNGLNIQAADVTEADAVQYDPVDVLHASPPCPNFSVAKTGGAETDEDVSLARATVTFISATRPQLFTLENVWGYRKSQSWRLIREHLQRSGYDWNAWRLCAADYGVPQTRKRMIVAARKGGSRPKKPPATHAENPSGGGLFGSDLSKWVGWYEAIEDLIPDLPETELADWQKERLPDELTNEFMVFGQTTTPAGFTRAPDTPQFCIRANPKGNQPRAVLVNTNQSGDDGSTVRQRIGDDSVFSVNPPDGGRLRAVLVHGQQTNPAASGKREDRTAITKEDEEPTFSINATAYKGTGRAVLIGDNANASSGSRIHRDKDEPTLTVRKSTGGHNFKCALNRCVVQMTPRCLARFQSFPDWYDLPESKSLACRIIGNAVPPLAMKKWVECWTA